MREILLEKVFAAHGKILETPNLSLWGNAREILGHEPQKWDAAAYDSDRAALRDALAAAKLDGKFAGMIVASIPEVGGSFILPARAAANLHDDIFFVIGVFGKEQNLDFFGKSFLLRLGGGVGFLTKLLHFRVRHQLLSVRHVLLRLIVGVKGFHNGLQIVFFPEQLRRLLRVGVKIRLLGLGGKLFVFIADGL